jgi:hypothetical protein
MKNLNSDEVEFENVANYQNKIPVLDYFLEIKRHINVALILLKDKCKYFFFKLF